MEEIREILIQDLSDTKEIELFEKYNLYRRNKTLGQPLYFAPYFTADSNKPTGISHFSKVLSVLTFRRSEFETIIFELDSFSNDKFQKDNWIKGVQMESNFTPSEEEQTFYFLDKPIKFMIPLMKDHKNSEGWIARNIPKNRVVSFIDLLQHIPELIDKQR